MSLAAAVGFPAPTGTLLRTYHHDGDFPILGGFKFSHSHPPRVAVRRRAPARVHRAEEGQKVSSDTLISNWGEFASCVSGEWDGYGAEFSSDGKPLKLPENVVPEAFREWDVDVFDWQTQCPTLAETGTPTLTYKLIKLLPTVGCEADAATRYSTEERVVGGCNSGVSAFAYTTGGSYVAVWNFRDHIKGKIVELEHCLVNPSDQSARIRVIQVICMEGETTVLLKIKVFAENWYGPFRNGEQLGGCAICESGFAATRPLVRCEVEGAWQGSRAIATFESAQSVISELVDDIPKKFTRDCEGLVTLPKNLWCSVKDEKKGETRVEVGWLLHKGHAVTSSCILSGSGNLKSIVMAQEAAVLEDNCNTASARLH